MESADLVHKDLATRFLLPSNTSSAKSLQQFDLPVRNVLVFPGHRVKISQCGMARPLYASDYSPLGPGGKLVPLRWMAWESLLLVSLSLIIHNQQQVVNWKDSWLIFHSLCLTGCVHQQERRVVVWRRPLGDSHFCQGAAARGRC